MRESRRDPIDINAINAYTGDMAVLNIRNLPDEVRDRLRVRAAKAGRSMEAEARAILAEACTVDDPVPSALDLPSWVNELYGTRKPRRVAVDLIAERRRASRRE